MFTYKNAAHKALLPHEIAAIIESYELALYLALRDGVSKATIRQLENQLCYWQEVSDNYW